MLTRSQSRNCGGGKGRACAQYCWTIYLFDWYSSSQRWMRATATTLFHLFLFCMYCDDRGRWRRLIFCTSVLYDRSAVHGTRILRIDLFAQYLHCHTLIGLVCPVHCLRATITNASGVRSSESPVDQRTREHTRNRQTKTEFLFSLSVVPSCTLHAEW